jgi:hypothetical protein
MTTRLLLVGFGFRLSPNDPLFGLFKELRQGRVPLTETLHACCAALDRYSTNPRGSSVPFSSTPE